MSTVDSLADATKRLRTGNDQLEAALRKDRTSQPPSAPRQPVAPVEITAERAQQIAKALKHNHTLLTLVSLMGVEPPITPSEFQAFCDLIKESTK